MADARLFDRLTLLAEEEFDIPKERFLRDAKLSEKPLSFDELMVVELMFTIEEEFRETGIEFNDIEFKKCVTFGDVADITERMLQGKEQETELAYERQVREREDCGEDTSKFRNAEKPKTVKKKEDPIRELQKQKTSRGRHGRHSRRESKRNDNEKSSDKAFQRNGRSRPRVGREDCKGSCEVATSGHERCEMADGKKATS